MNWNWTETIVIKTICKNESKKINRLIIQCRMFLLIMRRMNHWAITRAIDEMRHKQQKNLSHTSLCAVENWRFVIFDDRSNIELSGSWAFAVKLNLNDYQIKQLCLYFESACNNNNEQQFELIVAYRVLVTYRDYQWHTSKKNLSLSIKIDFSFEFNASEKGIDYQ